MAVGTLCEYTDKQVSRNINTTQSNQSCKRARHFGFQSAIKFASFPQQFGSA